VLTGDMILGSSGASWGAGFSKPRGLPGGGDGRVVVVAFVFVGIGPAWPAPWWYYPAPTYVYTPPPTIVVQPAPVYMVPPPRSYWYFCQTFNAYYPQVSSCPEPWVTVPTPAH
jgi:hypothetical protein